MPDRGINVWTQFTADRSILEGGRALAAGVSGGLEAVGKGISKMLEEQKKVNEQAQVMDSLVKKDPTILQGMGIDPEIYKSWDARKRTSTVRGAIAATEFQNKVQELEANKQKVAEALAQRKVPKQLWEAFANDPALGGYYENPERYSRRPGASSEMRNIVRAYAEADAPMSPAVVGELMRGEAQGRDFDLRQRKFEAEGAQPGAIAAALRAQNSAAQEQAYADRWALPGAGALSPEAQEEAVPLPRLNPMLMAILEGSDKSGAGLPPGATISQLLEDQGAAGGRTVWEDPVTGVRHFIAGKSVMPSGINTALIKSVDVLDPNSGELMSLPVNPRTGQPMINPRAQTQRKLSTQFREALASFGPALDSPDPKRSEAARRVIKREIDSAHIEGAMTDEQRDDFYGAYGIDLATRPTKTPAASRAGAGARTAPRPTAADYDTELKWAKEALKAGRDPKTVANDFLKRTGKPLPAGLK